MARRIQTIEIERADRGVVIRVDDCGDNVTGPQRWTEIIEGYGDSANFVNRVRRRVAEIVSEWYPTTTAR